MSSSNPRTAPPDERLFALLVEWSRAGDLIPAATDPATFRRSVKLDNAVLAVTR